MTVVRCPGGSFVSDFNLGTRGPGQTRSVAEYASIRIPALSRNVIRFVRP